MKTTNLKYFHVSNALFEDFQGLKFQIHGLSRCVKIEFMTYCLCSSKSVKVFLLKMSSIGWPHLKQVEWEETGTGTFEKNKTHKKEEI